MPKKKPKKEVNILSKYFNELKKTDKLKSYKVFEKYKKSAFNTDLKNQDDDYYWKIFGETEWGYGEVLFFETKETLRGKRNSEYLKCRPKYMNLKYVLNDGQRKEVLKHFPKFCKRCGFHRFFGIKISETSVARFFSIMCPNCENCNRESTLAKFSW